MFKVEDSGLSYSAGLKMGDNILKVDGNKIKNLSEMMKEVGFRERGSTMKITVDRDGVLKELIISF